MWLFLFESYWHLIRVEILMRTGRGLTSIETLVRNQAMVESRRTSVLHARTLCHAMDLASVFYPRRVLCLQRSSATTILLRRHGFPAEMVIGAKQMPFRSHAWVEVGGDVANDKPYVTEIYQELHRC
jgi:hypothetical protein